MKKKFFLLLNLFFISSILSAKTIFVNLNATGTNNGTSWTNAYTDLQNAINNAISGDEIWVAKGTYYPTRPADNLNTIDLNNRKNSFTIVNDIKLYGGFTGNETTLNQRDWNTNQTILDGNIGNSTNLDNCYHVVIFGNNTAVLDGFIVQNGRADDFSNNFIVIRSTALYTNEGAGITSYAIVNSFKNLIIRKNYCNNRAGGIYCHGATESNLDNLLIEENISNSGDAAGIFDDAHSLSNYSNLKIINNTSYLGRGGIYISKRFSGNRYLKNLIVQGNTGGIYIDAPSATISNSLFTGNFGSAIFSDNANVTLSNITVTGNNSNSQGAVHLFGNSHKVYNSILWGNSYPDITVYVSSTIDYKNNNINFGLPITATNINQNPFFINPLPIGLNSGGDYRLSCGSQCIDAGNNTFITSGNTLDLDNINRIIGSSTDIGAYEFDGTSKPLLTNSNIYYCQNEMTSTLTATGTNLLWYTSATGGTGSSIAPTPNSTSVGTTTYYVTQTVAGCESPRAAITVEVKAPSAMPTVTPSVNYCQNQTASALSATGTNLLWYTTSTGGTGSTTAPTPNTSSAGTTTYYVTQNTNGCESARAAINVIVDNTPVAPSVTSQITYCQNEIPSALTASGNNLLWYTTPTGGTGSATAPIPNTSTSGTTTYYVTQTVGCESPRSAITVTVNSQPQSPAITSSLTYCQNETTSTLTATGTNLLWYTSATGGTGSSIAPTPNSTSVGTTTYYVTQTVAGCESTRAAITVEVKAPSTLPTVTPSVNYCQNQTASALSATGTNLLWYTTSTGGTGSTTAPTPNTSSAGTTTYYVTQNTNGCESARAAINVIVDNAPVAPSVTPQITYCQNEIPSALTASGNNLLWYTTSTGGSGSATAPIPNTSTSGTTTYYVTQTVGCESPRSVITVTVNSQPQSPAITSSQTYCQNETTSTLSATGTNLLWYTSATGGTGSSIAPKPNSTSVGTTTYYVTQTVAGCESTRAAITVEVKAPSTLPTVTSTVNYCQNQTAIALSATGTNLLWYTSATGGTGSTTAPIPSTTTAGTTIYYVTQNTNGCESARTPINVTIGSAPTTPIVTPKISYCQNETATPLSATGTSLLWYTAASGGTGSTTAPIPNTTTAGTSTYYVTQTIGCESQRSAIEVTVLALPTIPLSGGSICKDKNNALTPFTLTTNLDPSRYSFQWYTLASGNPVIIPNATQNNHAVTIPGEYGVTIKDNNSVLGCTSEIIKAKVTIENEPIAIAITQSAYFSNNTTIKIDVEPTGNYEYQLDNSSFQTNNIFTNVKPGKHEIRVSNACGSIAEEVLIVDYPSFFTPNGDGFNDTWNIDALQNQIGSSIEIYDRFSKLITVIKPSGIGWDGTYQGKKLPSDDYWFVIHYTDANNINKTFKAHFSLKR